MVSNEKYERIKLAAASFLPNREPTVVLTNTVSITVRNLAAQQGIEWLEAAIQILEEELRRKRGR